LVCDWGDDILTLYNYEEGLKRISDILDNKLEVEDNSKLPAVDNLTFENAYYSWVSAIFVDIRNSTGLFTSKNKVTVSKIIRCFTSEIIEILRTDDNMREIGIRGDCVYAIYTTPSQDAIYECAEKTFWVNTYMKMLNKALHNKNFPEIKAGIGMGTAQELIVKAGRKGTGINNTVWIGDAVTSAANLSSVANKNGYSPIAYSEIAYVNFIEELSKTVNQEDVKSWFNFYTTKECGEFYNANIIKVDYDNWIKTRIPSAGPLSALYIK
jgi:class 3 adenylate cyclase